MITERARLLRQPNTIGRLVSATAVTFILLVPAVEVRAMPTGVTAAADSDLTAIITEFAGAAPGGVSALVVRDGVETSAMVGAASADGTPIQHGTRFRVASISKVFVAAMVLQLADEGAVDLDAPLSTYVPDAVVGGDVAVRLLLRHRSGLGSYMDDEAFLTDQAADLERIFTPDELLGYIADEPAGEPDTEWVYMNTNYILLGQLVEALDGTDLGSALQARIAGPLGLAATQYEIAGEPAPADLAGPWAYDPYLGDPATPYASVASGMWAAGAIVSTPTDVHTFLAALVGGELISAASYAEMIDPGQDGGYGLGIEILGFPSGAVYYGHRGETIGYRSFAGIEPITGDSVVVLTNNSDLDAVALSELITSDW